ncbi:unnamed protein product [Caenorhabditis bovis]|uniref:Glycosyltransferase family 92 protein n=1 Tax=Caenorhabditis bovis TaxID=2654633 RepID=A0A8S1F064_9PELO|nr:unnamed protein product [Caenorhabditis bovis]
MFRKRTGDIGSIPQYLKRRSRSSARRGKTWSIEELENFHDIRITAEHEKTTLLENYYGRPSMEIRITEAFPESHEVVTCSSPISEFSKLPKVISAISSAVAMGSFVNLPYAKIPGELYKFLRVYEQKSSMRLIAHPITRRKFEDDELRTELSFLNCMLMYRSKSKFLIFQSVDEIVLPILERDYFSEFARIFLKDDSQNVLEYNARIAATDALNPSEALHDAPILIKNSRIALVLRTPLEELESKISHQMYTTKLNNTQLSDQSVAKIKNSFSDSFKSSRIAFRKLGECFLTELLWKCPSGKCVDARCRHASIHGMYSYNIHQSIFLQIDSFDC